VDYTGGGAGRTGLLLINADLAFFDAAGGSTLGDFSQGYSRVIRLGAHRPRRRLHSSAAHKSAVRSSRRQRKNSRHELVEKRAGLHEDREVPASLDRDECPCRFELLAVGAGRRVLPGGRDGDANKKQE
jgi:hypothetical protein